MKNIIIILVICLFFFNCKEDKKNAQKIEEKINKENIVKIDSTEIDSIKREEKIRSKQKSKGRWDLMLFEGKYKRDKKPSKFPYSDGNLIKVYKLDCRGDCVDATFVSRISDGIDISKNDFSKLIKLLKNPNSYNKPTAACFEPKIAIIVYDDKNIPTEYLSICLDCNNLETGPGKLNIKYNKKRIHGFSESTRITLIEMFNKWGIDYPGYSTK